MTVHREQSMKREKNQQMQQLDVYYLTSISICFGHHYAHLQENKEHVTAFGVLFWFCWMWLVAVVGRCVVGCEHQQVATIRCLLFNFYLNLFRASLCPSSGKQRTRYCIWCVVLVLLDVVGSGCGALRCRMRAPTRCNN